MVSESLPQSENTNLLDGLRFVVTGRLDSYSRTEIQDLIKKHGGKVSGSISKGTDYLLAGQDGGAKLVTASTLGVQIITETEFESLIDKR